jgi:periodic tryptophan protein 2
VESESDEDQEHFSEFEQNCRCGRFILDKKHQFYQNNSRIKSAQFFAPLNLLIIGFKNGTFGMYNLIENQLTEIQTFAISNAKINTISLNSSGAWIAFGIESLG